MKTLLTDFTVKHSKIIEAFYIRHVQTHKVTTTVNPILREVIENFFKSNAGEKFRVARGKSFRFMKV